MLKSKTGVCVGTQKTGRIERILALTLIGLVTIVCIATLSFLMVKSLSCMRAFASDYLPQAEQSVSNDAGG